ncbi:MAG: hypothetical protein R2729_32850 [Bryobacteraceae bacterium]
MKTVTTSMWKQARALGFVALFGMAGAMFPVGLLAQSDAGVFGGPSILSRGTRPIGRSGGRPIRLRANLTFGTAYYGGLTPAGVEQDLSFPNQNGYAGYMGFGVAGTRETPRSRTSGQYQGLVNLFGNQLRFTGVNQSGQLTYERRINRQLTAFVAGRGLMYNTVLTGFSPVGYDQPIFDEVTAPQTETFDSRMIQAIGGAGLTYQKSARLSFSVLGAAGLQRRKSRALVDSNVYLASGEVNYRLSRRTAIGANYMFMDIFHRRGYGESYAHTYMATFQRTLSQHWDIGLGAGALRMESDRLQTVQVDPLVRALTGQSSALVAFHGVFWGMAGRASLNGNFRTSSTSFSYDRGANPGNGFVLSGQMERYRASYNYSGIRRASLGVFAMRVRFIPVLQAFNVRDYKSTGAGASFGYRLTNFLHFTSTAQYIRGTTTAATNFQRDRYVLTVGLALQPGEVPLVLW